MKLPPPLRYQLYIAFLPLMVLLAGMVAYSIVSFFSLDREYARTVENDHAAAKATDKASLALSRLMFGLTQIEKGDLDAGLENVKINQEKFDNNIGWVRTLQSEDEKIDTFVDEVESAYDALNRQAIEPVLSGLKKPPYLERKSEKDALFIDSKLLELEEYFERGIVDNRIQFQKRVRLSFLVLAGGFVLSALVALLVTYMLSNRLIAPIEKFREAADRIRDGNLELLTEEKSSREFELLSKALNEMIGQLKVFRELSDKKMMRTTNTLKTLLDRSPNPTLFLDSNMNVVYQNTPSLNVVGNDRGGTELPEALQSVLEKAIESQEVVFSSKLDDSLVININGKDKYFLPHVFPVDAVEGAKDIESSAEGIAVILQDITLLHLSDQLKNDLVATVSHELKTPLTSARMSLYLLKEEGLGQLNADQKDLVETALSDLNRQLATIQNLLDLSRVKESEQVMEFDEVDLHQLIQSRLEAVEELANSKSVTISAAFLSSESNVHADSQRLGVVVENLLTNAIKHSPPEAKIEIITQTESCYRVITVKDEGPGIPKAMQGKIFDKFFQPDKEKRNNRGTGLGLYIAKEIVKAHRGEISCHSEVDRGSEFTVRIPV